MYAAFYLVVLAVVWSASDLGRTAEAKETGTCKALVDRAIKIVNAVKRFQEDRLPTCKCGKYISQIEVTDKDTKETTTLDLCTGCPGNMVPLKKSDYCQNHRNRGFRNFAPFCRAALDQCNGKGITINTCKCQGDDNATTQIPDPATTQIPDPATTQGQGSQTTAGGQVPVDWMNY